MTGTAASLCGGGLIVEHSNNKKGRYAYYICHHHRVMDTCTNALCIFTEVVNEAVLRQIEQERLHAGSHREAELKNLRLIPRLAPQVIEDRLGEWRRSLRGSTTQGRTVLQRILKGRVTFTPRADGDGYDFTADTRFDKLFSGIVVPDPEFGQRRGLEHLTDAIDADYGR